MENSKYFTDLAEWKNWLSKNHDKENILWMIFYKKHTKKICISYKDALQEALCWGWIDSLIKRIDDEKYARKFTPRTNLKNWSEINKQHIRELIVANRMTEFGLTKIDLRILDDPPENKANLEISEYILIELNKHPKAKLNFDKLAPSAKQNYIGWINDAKRDETKLRRLLKAIEMLKSNKKQGMK
jgi:uncharacterized protein YdeI (YjbR/CyaY-like superfamily)